MLAVSKLPYTRQGQVAVSTNHSPLYVPQIGVIKYKHVDWTLTSSDLYYVESSTNFTCHFKASSTPYWGRR